MKLLMFLISWDCISILLPELLSELMVNDDDRFATNCSLMKPINV